MNPSAKILIISESGKIGDATAIFQGCLTKQPRLIAIFGKDCGALEDICDQIIEESDSFVTTTSHPDESLEDVIAMVKIFDHADLGEQYEVVKI